MAETTNESAVITTVVLTQEQVHWLLEMGAKLFPPKSPLSRPSVSRTLRAILDWAIRTDPTPEVIISGSREMVSG